MGGGGGGESFFTLILLLFLWSYVVGHRKRLKLDRRESEMAFQHQTSLFTGPLQMFLGYMLTDNGGYVVEAVTLKAPPPLTEICFSPVAPNQFLVSNTGQAAIR